MLRIYMVLLATVFLVSAWSQENSLHPWKPIQNHLLISKTIEIHGKKVSGTLYQLDQEVFRKTLHQLYLSDDAHSSVSVSFPINGQKTTAFNIKKSQTLHPDLQKRFPDIWTFEGSSKEYANTTLRMEWSHKGLFVMIWQKGTVHLLQATNHPSKSHYLFYNKKSVDRTSAFHCETEEDIHYKEIRERLGSQSRSSANGQSRRYRLALACTGEYTEFHGGSLADALAAMATTMNRVNGIFKKELSLELQLVANNDKIIYLDSATDPFKNDSGSQMLTANQEVCDSEIGSANYDIGHVFSTGGGGVAYLNSTCFDAIKAGGVTGQPMPIGDAYDIDFVTHEMGHQFGATHTQNNDCNRSFASAFEPGSGSTIMSYSGICFPNVQNNSDAYFHGYSLQQISTYLEGAGTTCAVSASTGNTPPSANAGRDYFMPIGTPFELVGSGEDANAGQLLTYNWEQMNNEIASMPPSPTATEGPAYRSFSPQEEPNRYFPSMEWLLSKDPSQWEVLPMIERSMKFRLTVRDNFEEGGCYSFDEMEITFIQDAGPFKVKIPNEPIFYAANSNQTVRWEVASTDKQPINVETVDILLSTDGGHTFPIVLAENVPNDGSQEVQMPATITDKARIKIKSNNHILFDISDHDFSITESTPDFNLTVSPTKASVCRGNAVQFTVNVEGVQNFNGAINLGTNANNIFSNFNFSQATPLTGENSILTINTAGMAPGNYTIEVSGVNGARVKTRFIELSISPNTSVSLTNELPEDKETDLTLQPVFQWESSDATATYTLQVATDPNFNNLVFEEKEIRETQFASLTKLEHSRTYYWRVQATNQCGVSDYSTATQFTISNTLCLIYTSADIPEIIPVQGTPEVSSLIPLEDEGTVKSIRVLDIQINHSWINDLTATLQSPTGTKVILFDQICGNENEINLSFGTEGPAHSNLPCPPESNDIFQPQQSLAAFDGEPIAGNWTLLVKDHFNLDGGRLDNWAIEVCRVVKENISLNVVITEKENPSCADGKDGFIKPNIFGGTPPYTIQWNTGTKRLVQEELAAGTYTVTVTDADGATAVAQTSLTAPSPIRVTNTVNAPTCADGADGNILLNVTGGKAPYQYEWAHGASTSSTSQLSAGTYTVVISDANRCPVTSEITLVAPEAITLNFETTDITATNNGSINLAVNGGTAPYTYNWSNNSNNNQLLSLSAGDFEVTVTDAIGCTKFGQITLDNPSNVDCQMVTIEVVLDNYGIETSWDIKNENGVVFAQGGPYANFTREELQTAQVCLEAGCYDFTIYDQWGDGICCSYGNGKFTVIEDDSKEVLVSGSKFQQRDKTTFCLSDSESQSAIKSYCTADGDNTVYEWIESVTINEQAFKTGSNGGYFYNRDTPVDIIQGGLINLAFTPGFGFNSYGENWQVWIDWNRDGDLEDNGEMVFFGSGEQTVYATIEVPSYATVGHTKMRVAMKWGNQIGPCESFNWGEVEDYLLNILPSSSLTENTPTIEEDQQRIVRDTSTALHLFPNPTADLLFVNWESDKEQIKSLRLFDRLGKEVILPSSNISFSSKQIKVQLPPILNGVYFLQLTGQQRLFQKQFIVVK